jgi:putative glutamine amidotransferase
VGGLQIDVNSLHHQAIQTLAPDFVIAATAPDGVIEAIEKRDHPFLMGVQWHPEWMPGSPAMTNLFDCFVESCLQ